MRKKILRHLALFLHTAILVGVLGITLQACSRPELQGGDGAGPTATAVEPIDQATATPEATPTIPPGGVVLVAPAGADASQAEQVKETLSDLAHQSGLEFQAVADPTQIDFGNPVRIVATLAPDAGIAQLAATHTDVQFLGIGIPDLQATGNLSSIGAGGERPDQQGFLAGYLAAVITDDWRIAAISPSDSTAGQASRLGFINGAIFFCGLCRPVFPPFVQYPQSAEIPGGAGEAEIQAAVDSLVANGVKTVYVYPGTGDGVLMNYLAQAGMNIIGGRMPGEELSERWVASIQTDLPAALREIWPDLVNGSGGQALAIPITITQQNEQLFSPGRQELVEKMLIELIANYIDTGVDPLTGTLK